MFSEPSITPPTPQTSTGKRLPKLKKDLRNSKSVRNLRSPVTREPHFGGLSRHEVLERATKREPLGFKVLRFRLYRVKP